MIHKSQMWGALALLAVNSAVAQAAETPAPAAPPVDNALKVKEEFSGRNGLGVSLGMTSGIGFSYRRYLNDDVALRAGGYVFYLKDSFSLYSLGLTAQYDFRRDSKYTVYGLGGIGFARGDRAATETLGPLLINPGAGVGLELGSHTRAAFTVNVELLLTGMFADGAFQRLLPLPQVGLHYNF